MIELDLINTKNKLKAIIIKKFNVNEEESLQIFNFLIEISKTISDEKQFIEKINEIDDEIEISFTDLKEIFFLTKKFNKTSNENNSQLINFPNSLTLSEKISKEFNCLNLPNVSQKNMEELLLDFDEVNEETENSTKLPINSSNIKSYIRDDGYIKMQDDKYKKTVKNNCRSRSISYEKLRKEKKLDFKDIREGHIYDGTVTNVFQSGCER